MEAVNPIKYFAGGPSKIPSEVLAQVSKDLLSYEDAGVGVMEISHRSPHFTNILTKALDNVRAVLSVPDTHKILFMAGGGTGQFAAVPLNLMGREGAGTADYVVTGNWSKGAAAEAKKFGEVRLVLGEGAPSGVGVPPEEEWVMNPQAAYLYYCDNETIEGVEFPHPPTPPAGVPLVCDMSSNICTRKIDFSKFGIVFAGAQKNLGCAGITLVIIRSDLLALPALPHCPVLLDYAAVAAKNSVYNTPPVYAIHVLGQVVSWLLKRGGLERAERESKEKSEALYAAIDGSSGRYVNAVEPRYRSRVNVVFTVGRGETRDTQLETKFMADGKGHGIYAIKGHRSVGGMRASLFNSVSPGDVDALVVFMQNFALEHPQK